MNKLKCASFFAGVGGIDLGFEQTNGYESIYANEFDKYAVQTYNSNYNIKVDTRDISIIPVDEIPDFDVMLAGFPCQAFSIAGKQEGFNDSKKRGKLFFELIRILKDKKPKIVFLENVKNLVTHDFGNTFDVIQKELKQIGYHIKYQVMNATEYGNVPQNRERIYIVGFLDEQLCNKFQFPCTIPLTTPLSSVIDFHSQVEDSMYYTPERFQYYNVLTNKVVNQNTVYQWRRTYVRENKSNVCPTLTAAMGMGGHNVPIVLTDNGIRKITPKECFNLQGFPVDFKLPNISNCQLYKQAGNSVVVPVIRRIANQILIALGGDLDA